MAQDNRTVDQQYDDELKKQQDSLKTAAVKNNKMYDDLRKRQRGVNVSAEPALPALEEYIDSGKGSDFNHARRITAETIDKAIETGALSQEEVDTLKKVKEQIIMSGAANAEEINPVVDTKTQNGTILVPELQQKEAKAELVDYRQMPLTQINQNVQNRIQNNAQTNPQGIQKSIINGIMALDEIDTRMKRRSRNVNNEGIDISRAYNAYVSYFFEGGDLNTSAQEIAAGIRDVITTSKLKAADVEKLTSAVGKMVGDAELVQVYVDGAIEMTTQRGLMGQYLMAEPDP